MRHRSSLLALAAFLAVPCPACWSHPGMSSKGPDAGLAEAAALLQTLSGAMKSFYASTGGWPYENTVWYAEPNSTYPQIDPRPFNPGDTALFTVALSPTSNTNLPACSSGHAGSYDSPCWDGPYVGKAGQSLGASPWLDPWGHALLYTYVRPDDGWGGGISSAPNGFIVIWSMGPDGMDGIGCSDGSCSVDYSKLALGECSDPGCDDISVVVADASE